MSIAPAPTGDSTGLDASEAGLRLQKNGPNTLPGAKPKSWWAMAAGVVLEPMFLMLLFAGGLYLALGDRAEAIFLMLSVLVIIGITLVQQHKTERALEALRDLSAPRARVVRDACERLIASSDVVVGDRLVLHEGDRIAADATLLSGHLDADESMLTGESVPVGKSVGAKDKLFAGTVVTRGRGFATVNATGARTAIGHIGRALETTTAKTSPLQRASRRLVRYFAVAALFCAGGLFLLNWLWEKGSLLDSLLTAVALAMAILPEEFPVILTIFMALGAWRIARHKVLTRRLSAVEALGEISVLAVDKTGTLTQNRMHVAELYAGQQGFVAQSSCPAHFDELIRFARLATPGDSFDPMEKAILAFGKAHPERTSSHAAPAAPAREYALDPTLLAMSMAFADGPPATYLIAGKGAPEAIVELCTLDVGEKTRVQAQVLAMAERGLRVIAVAAATHHGSEWPDTQRGFHYRFLGLIGLIDPPRPEVAAAIGECHAAGIRVIMMTGDHPATARAIAAQVGLGAAVDLITGEQMDALGDGELGERLRHVGICARVQPIQKLRLVRTLQHDGDVVGMTGDGVNDAPALKAADVGIAMGERGTDVAREAAAIVLLDDNFASLVLAIRQGRRINDNIAKASRFVVAVHVPIVAMAMVPSMMHWPILLMPVQIVLLQLLIDPACSIVFESARPSPTLMQRPPRASTDSPFRLRNLVYGALQGMGLAAILLLGYALVLRIGTPAEQGRLAVFAGLLVGVFLLTLANQDLGRALWRENLIENPWLLRMLGGIALVMTLMVVVGPLRVLLGLGSPGATAVAFAVAMLAISMAWLEMVRRVGPRVGLAAVT